VQHIEVFGPEIPMQMTRITPHNVEAGADLR
jgi:hypothetical protein